MTIALGRNKRHIGDQFTSGNLTGLMARPDCEHTKPEGIMSINHYIAILPLCRCS